MTEEIQPIALLADDEYVIPARRIPRTTDEFMQMLTDRWDGRFAEGGTEDD